MILFGSVGLSVVFMLVGMFFMGTWPNLFKYREREVHKEHLFIIYSISALMVSIVAALTLGSYGPYEPNFIDNLYSGSLVRIIAALAGGFCISMSNQLVVYGNTLSGFAIAMPISSGISVIGGTLLNYAITPVSKFWLLMLGISFIVIALVFESLTVLHKQQYQSHHIDTNSESLIGLEKAKEGHLRGSAQSAEESCHDDTEVEGYKDPSNMKRGIILSVISGIVGCFWSPLGSYSMENRGFEGSLSAYTSFFFFMIGFLITSIFTNLYFMYRPVDGKKPTTFRALFHLDWRFYLIGIAAGTINGIGNLLNFIAGQSSGGFAVSFAIARANTLVSGIYGIIIWKEFQNTDAATKILYAIGVMFYIGALVSVSLSL